MSVAGLHWSTSTVLASELTMGSLSYDSVSTGELYSFMVNRLHLPEWKSAIEKDKRAFLTKIYQCYVTNIPFQNLSRVARPTSEFGAPTKEEIIRDVLAGLGGGCTTLNYFFYVLLNTLGYDAFTVKGTFIGTGHPDTHLITIVRFPEAELFLCDVGSTSLMYEPIPIVPKSKYRRVDVDGIGYEYSETEDTGSFSFAVVKGSYYGRLYPEDEPQVQTKFTHNLNPKEYVEDDPYSKISYVDPENFLMQIPCLYRFTRLDEENQSYVMVTAKTVVQYDSSNPENPRKVTRFPDVLAASDFIQEQFPMLDPAMIRQALEFFSNVKKQPIILPNIVGS